MYRDRKVTGSGVLENGGEMKLQLFEAFISEVKIQADEAVMEYQKRKNLSFREQIRLAVLGIKSTVKEAVICIQESWRVY